MAHTPSSRWTLSLLTFFGIPVRVHVSLLAFLGFVGFQEAHSGGDALREVLFVLSLFVCVFLHELGHALVARRFGIKTRDITLYPFGGIAAMLGEARPAAELCIAASGPIVNFLLALAIFPFLDFSQEFSLGASADVGIKFFIANVLLGLFNLIPALPMDGGRILRAVLSLFGVKKSTQISARIGQVISFIIALFAVYHGAFLLLIIATLVFSSALQEHLRDRARTAAEGHLVSEVMIDASHLESFTHGMTVSTALKIALKSLQTNFPVVHCGEIIGVIDRQDLIQLGAIEDEESYISGHMDREFAVVSPEQKLEDVLDLIHAAPGNAVLVMAQGTLVGMLIKDKVLEYLLVQEFRRRTRENAQVIDEEI